MANKTIVLEHSRAHSKKLARFALRTLCPRVTPSATCRPGDTGPAFSQTLRHHFSYCGAPAAHHLQSRQQLLCLRTGRSTPSADIDGDCVPDDSNNCYDTANPDQTDSDIDTTGDACDLTPYGDPDTDGDGLPDAQDPTPNGDTDGDGIDNAADPTPNGDSDGDGVDEIVDNCVTTPNPDQLDTDSNGLGDACDAPLPPSEPDTDADGIPWSPYRCPKVSSPSTTSSNPA
jgi:hypothetical protein